MRTVAAEVQDVAGIRMQIAGDRLAVYRRLYLRRATDACCELANLEALGLITRLCSPKEAAEHPRPQAQQRLPRQQAECMADPREQQLEFGVAGRNPG